MFKHAQEICETQIALAFANMIFKTDMRQPK